MILGENEVYGIQDPEMAIITLAIDDGVPGRSHRANIF